jgi:class 3 adenylate cyclase
MPAAAAGGPPKYLLMSDMVRSTQISVAAGDAVYLSLVDAHRAILRRRLRERGGVEVDTAGDGLFAWLRSAADAVWCGLEAQRDVAALAPGEHGQRLEIRIGVTSGRPIERGGRLYGAAVNLSDRLCKAAAPGEVVVSESLLTELPVGLETSPLGRLNLASFPEPVEVHRVRLASHGERATCPEALTLNKGLPEVPTVLAGADPRRTATSWRCSEPAPDSLPDFVHNAAAAVDAYNALRSTSSDGPRRCRRPHPGRCMGRERRRHRARGADPASRSRRRRSSAVDRRRAQPLASGLSYHAAFQNWLIEF